MTHDEYIKYKNKIKPEQRFRDMKSAIRQWDRWTRKKEKYKRWTKPGEINVIIGEVELRIISMPELREF